MMRPVLELCVVVAITFMILCLSSTPVSASCNHTNGLGEEFDISILTRTSPTGGPGRIIDNYVANETSPGDKERSEYSYHINGRFLFGLVWFWFCLYLSL